MNEIWIDSDGTLVAELSELELNRPELGKVGIIALPNKLLADLTTWDTDRNDDGEIIGWRREVHGQKYLVIND